MIRNIIQRGASVNGKDPQNRKETDRGNDHPHRLFRDHAEILY